jgi:hypothetical protein
MAANFYHCMTSGSPRARKFNLTKLINKHPLMTKPSYLFCKSQITFSRLLYANWLRTESWLESEQNSNKEKPEKHRIEVLTQHDLHFRFCSLSAILAVASIDQG